MPISLGVSRQAIRDRLASNFSQTVIEGSAPSYQELHRENGIFAPYLVFNFADLGSGLTSSLIGPRGDVYQQAFNVYGVGPSVQSSTDLYLKILDQFIGFQPPYSGQIGKRPGGGTFVVSNDNGTAQAFITVASFQFTTELLNIN